MLKKKWLGNLCLLLISPVVFFLLIESFLWVFQVESLRKDEDPLLSFSTDPLFEKQIEKGHTYYKTSLNKQAFFNPQKFTEKKEKNDRRIFVLGGSTAYGRPYRDIVSFSGWLRGYLEESSTTKKWDVINASGVSYASYRIVKLVEEFLDYDSDYFIVYMGHNEFLENRTYEKVKNLPFILRWINQKISKMRLYALGFRLVKSRETNVADNDKTKSVLNTSIEKEVNTKLDYAIGPEQFFRNDSHRKEVVDHFKLSLTRMVNLAAKKGIPIILVKPASNLKDCSPFKSQWDFSTGQDSSHILKTWEEAKLEEENGNKDKAMRLYQVLIKENVRYAELHYRLGKLFLKQKKYSLAKEHFLLAKEEDVCPLRILSPLQKVLNSFKGNSNVIFLDANDLLERNFQKKYKHSILGEEFFFDHVHLRIEQHQFLSKILISIIDSLENSKMDLLNQEKLTEALLDTNILKRVNQKIRSKINNAEKGLALHQLAKVLNWSGKYEDAVKIAHEAIKLNSTHPEAYFSFSYIATYLDRKGKVSEAITYYRKALNLDSLSTEMIQFLAYSFFRQKQFDSSQVYYEKLLPYTKDQIKIDLSYKLGRLSIINRQWKTAVEYFISVEGVFSRKLEWIYGVGLSFLKLGKYEESKPYFERILREVPNHPWANLNMGIIFEKEEEWNQAQYMYKKVLYIDPNLKEARDRSESLKERLKDTLK